MNHPDFIDSTIKLTTALARRRWSISHLPHGKAIYYHNSIVWFTPFKSQYENKFQLLATLRETRYTGYAPINVLKRLFIFYCTLWKVWRFYWMDVFFSFRLRPPHWKLPAEDVGNLHQKLPESAGRNSRFLSDCSQI